MTARLLLPSRVLVVIALCVGLVPASAVAATPSAVANDIPTAVALPPSPATGSVDTMGVSVVYSVHLDRGQKLVASITGPEETDFDLFLYPPGAQSINTPGGEDVASSQSAEYPDALGWTADVTGTYYLEVYPLEGTGDYTIDWETMAGEANDILPGVALSGSPVTGTLDASIDVFDIRSMAMARGSRLTYQLTAAEPNDFSTFIVSSSASSILAPTTTMYAISPTPVGVYPQQTLFVAPSTASYSIVNFANAGTGDFSATYYVDSIALTGPSTVAYGKAAVLAGTVTRDGVASAGRSVSIQKYSGSWKTIATTTTNASGVFSASVALSTKTSYRALLPLAGGPSAYSATTAVTPQVSLGRPMTSSTVKTGVTFSLYGFLKPRHTAGARSVRIYAYKKEGDSWNLKKSSTMLNANYSTYTKYAGRFSLPGKGQWRLKAYVANDSKHAATSSTYRYMTAN